MPIKDEVLVARPLPVTLPAWEDSEPVDVPQWDDSEEVPTLKIEPWQEPGLIQIPDALAPVAPQIAVPAESRTEQLARVIHEAGPRGSEARERAALAGRSLLEQEGFQALPVGEKAMSAAEAIAQEVAKTPGRLMRGGAVQAQVLPPPRMEEPGVRMLPNVPLRQEWEVKSPTERAQAVTGSELFKAGQAVEQAAERAHPTAAGSEASFWWGDVPRGIGSMGTSIGTGLVGGPAAGIGVATILETMDAFDQEMGRQVRTGEQPDPGKAWAKATGYGALTVPIESGLGVGRLIRNITKRFGRTGAEEALDLLRRKGKNGLTEFAKNRAKDAGLNAAQEGIEALSQDLIVEGEADWANVVRSAGAGAVAGTIAGGAGEAGARGARRIIGPPPSLEPPITGRDLLQREGAIPPLQAIEPTTERTPDDTQGEERVPGSQPQGPQPGNVPIVSGGQTPPPAGGILQTPTPPLKPIKVKFNGHYEAFGKVPAFDLYTTVEEGKKGTTATLEELRRQGFDPQIIAEPPPPAVTPPKAPEPSTDTVRVYHGEEAGSGASGSWFTIDPKRARTFGKNVSFVDLPRDVYEQLRKEAEAKGTPEKDLTLPDEWVKKGQPIEIEETVHDLDAETEYKPSATLGPVDGSPEYNALPMGAKSSIGEFEINQKIIDTGLHPDGKKATKKQIEELKLRQDQVRKNFERNRAVPIAELSTPDLLKMARGLGIKVDEESIMLEHVRNPLIARITELETKGLLDREAAMKAGAIPPKAPEVPPVAPAETKPAPAATKAPKVETVKPVSEPTSAELEPWLKVPEVDDSQAKEAANYARRQVEALRTQYKELEQQRIALDKLVMTGSKFRRHMKRSARKKDIDAFREVQKKQQDVETQIRAIENASRGDADVTERAMEARRVNDASRTPLSRLGARINLFHASGEKVPAEVERIFIQMTRAEVQKRFPDLRPQELEAMGREIERAARLGDDLKREFEINPALKGPFAGRRAELAKHVQDLRNQGNWNLWPEELIRKLEEKSRSSQPYGERDKPLPELSIKELEELKAEASEAAEVAAGKAKAIEELAAKQKAADEAEAQRLLDEAQAVVDSQPRTRKATAIKEELIDRIEEQMDKTIAAAKVTLVKNAELIEGAESYSATAESGGKFVQGTIRETPNGRFEVTAKVTGSKNPIKGLVDTRAEAERIIKVMSADASGRAVIAVPGDGIFTLHRNGENLANLWQQARSIVTSATPTGPKAPASGRPKAAPKLPKTVDVKAAILIMRKQIVDRKSGRPTLSDVYSDGKHVYATDGRVLVIIDAVQPVGGPEGFPVEAIKKDVWPDEMEGQPASVPTEELWRISRLAKSLYWKDSIPRVQLFVDDKGNIAGESMDAEGNAAGWGDPRGKRSLGFFDSEYIGSLAEIARALGHATVTLQAGVKGEGKQMSHPLVMKAPGIRALVGNVRDIEREAPKSTKAELPEGRAELEAFLQKTRDDLKVFQEQVKKVNGEEVGPVAARDQAKIDIARAEAKLAKLPKEEPAAPAEEEGATPEQIDAIIARWEKKISQLQDEQQKLNPRQRSFRAVAKDKQKRIGEIAAEIDAARKEIESLKSQRGSRGGGAKAYAAGERMPPRKPFNIFTATDAELDALHKERFGEMGGEFGMAYAGREAKIREFANFEEFKAWLDARYAERNLEHMQRAYAEADGKWKTKYIKTVNADPATDQLKRDVIAHIATGAPLPPGFVPVPPAAPPPGAPGAGGTTYQQPPPPPPREPTEYSKFDITALTQLFRYFSRFPQMNARLMKAYGQFVPNTGAVELKERLLWDTKLATRVLSHEIGHFVDLMLTPVGWGARDFARRFAPLRDFKRAVRDRKDLNQAAKALSAVWRGAFSPTNAYRNSAEELFADTMSALLTNPEMVNQQFPVIHDAFERFRADKPAFRNAYSFLTSWLRGDEIPDQILKQQAEANKRTLNDLLQEDTTPKQSYIDQLKQAVVSIWYPIYAIEGKPKAIGEKIISKLERSHVWADVQNALFYDDWLRRVIPNLKKVDPSMEKARALFHSFMFSDRVIKERRAGGQWIEQNPEPARAMLEELVKYPELSSYRAQLQSATDDALYDLAAQMMRTAHDRGPRFIREVDKAIDRLALGVEGDAVVHAFNVRGKLLNPGGVTPQRAAQIISTIRSRLTPEQFDALKKGADEFRAMVFDVTRKAHDEGLVSDRTWTEIVEPNAGNYVPYAVLDYWEGKVPAVVPQAGTARDVADVALAAHMKVASLNTWRQSQRQIKLIQQAYQNGGIPVLPGRALEHSSDIEKVRKTAGKDDISRAVMWVNGRPRVMEFPNDPHKVIEDALSHPAFYHHLQLLTRLNKITHNLMSIYTTFSPTFMGYRNPVRDVRTSATRIGFRATAGTTMQAIELGKLAANYAEAAFGGEMNPVIRDLVEREVLMPPRLATSVVRDQQNLTELIQNGAILAFHARRLKGETWKWYQGGEPGRKATQKAEQVFAAYEAFAKIQAYFSAKAKGLSEAESEAVARIAGIPNPGVMGKWSTPMEVFLPWFRVHIQGLRADLDVFRDPNLNRGFITRIASFVVLPRIAKVALGAGLATGLIKSLIPGKEDDDDLVLGEFFRRVSPYKMALDDIVPIAFYDPRTGKYHYLWEFKHGKDVPEHYEAVSWRIPGSEQDRIWGTLTYQMLSGLPMTKEALSRPGNGLVENMGAWLRDYAAVGVNPFYETGQNVFQGSMLGKNPEDSFTGRPAFNREFFGAGGKERAQAVAGYTMQRFGDAGYLAALSSVNLRLLDERVLNVLQSKMDGDKQAFVKRIPVLRSVFSYDNYARYRAERNVEIEQQAIRDRSKLVMSPEVHAMYQYYWRNQDREKQMDRTELQRFNVAKAWVNSAWGDLKTPGSLYSKAAHAVGPDGSAMAKETARRDIDAISRGYVLRFKAVK